MKRFLKLSCNLIFILGLSLAPVSCFETIVRPDDSGTSLTEVPTEASTGASTEVPTEASTEASTEVHPTQPLEVTVKVSFDDCSCGGGSRKH